VFESGGSGSCSIELTLLARITFFTQWAENQGDIEILTRDMVISSFINILEKG